MGRSMRIGRLCALAAMLASCEAPDAMVGAAGESLLCDLPVVEAPPRAPVDPCRDGALVLEHRFERSRGAPEDEVVAFSLGRTEPVCVTILSSGEGRRRVTAATVRIDDRVVAGPGRFDQQTSTIEERLFLEAGDHVLGARAASSPGTFLDVAIRAGGDDLRHAPVSGRYLELFDLFADPSPFSPALGPVTLSGRATILRLVGAPGPAELRLRWAFEIRDAASCELVRALSGEEPVGAPSTFTLFSEWDGTDEAGARVSDGVYAYRLVARLVRVDGRERVVEELGTAQQRLEVDGTPPGVHFIAPEFLASRSFAPALPPPPPARVRLPAGTPSLFELRGIALDPAGVESVRVVLNGRVLGPVLSGDERSRIFAAGLALATGADDYATESVLTVEATDGAGNRARYETVLRLLNPFHPSRMIVRFDAERGRAFQDEVLAELGTRGIVHVDLSHGLYVVDVSVPDVLAKSTELTARPGIAYAMPDGEATLLDLPGRPNDPLFGGLDSWHLDNDGTGDPAEMVEAILCDSMAPMPHCPAGQTCTPGACRCVGGPCDCCTCSGDADCRPSELCVSTPFRDYPSTYCAPRAVAGADVGWLAAGADLVTVRDGPDTVIVGVYEGRDGAGDGGVFQLDHPDLVDNVFTNEAECCASPPCPDADGDRLPDCVAGEIVPDRVCATAGDCAPGETCLSVPGFGRCTEGTVSGPACAIDADCPPGSAFCDTGAGACITRTRGRPCAAAAECGDGGACAVLPAVSRCSDGCAGGCGEDDDGDGFADLDDLDVASLDRLLRSNFRDDDGDCPGDTNGDGLVCRFGDDGVDEPDEARLVAWDDDENGVIDDVHGASFDGAAELGALFATTVPGRGLAPSGHATFVAGVVGAAIDNMEGIASVHPNVRLLALGGGPAEASSVLRYASAMRADIVNISWTSIVDEASLSMTTTLEQQIRIWTDHLRDGIDTNTLYTVSSGNAGADLDAELAAGRFWFPQQVVNDYDLVVGATTVSDDLTTFSNFGATTVDLSAPGARYLSTTIGGLYVPFGGTSASSPLVAGVAGVVMSRYPEAFQGHPLFLAERLRQTAEPVAAHAGLTITGGRVDLAEALDTGRFPLPTFPPYVDETRRLNDLAMLNTHDVDFIDADGDGRIEFLLEVFGGPFEDQADPRLYRFDPLIREFFDESAERILSPVRGNYNKAAVGDVTGDGCSDIVLGGFLQADPGGGLRGEANRLLVQERDSGGTCLGTWVEDSLFPRRDDITRDVDLIDFDGDGDLDVFFTNAVFPWPGGDLGDQLLRNDGRRPGPGWWARFTDVSAAKLPPSSFDPHKAAGIGCDVDGDGFIDLVIAVNGDQNRLLMNRPDPLEPGSRRFADETTTSGFPGGTGFSHDVECHDFTGDGRPDILFARRDELHNLFLANVDGDTFRDESWRLPAVADTTQEVEICNVDGEGPAEVLFGNGDIVRWLAQPNRIVRFEPGTGLFADAEAALGFNFRSTVDLTEDIECADMDGNGVVDMVLIGNTGSRNFLYVRQ